MNDFSSHYKTVVVPALREKFGLSNPLSVPKVTRVTLNVGVGKSLKDPAVLEIVQDSLSRITGQRPVKTKAKKSIASFKVRKGQVIGFSVTLRKRHMEDFLSKLIHVALPRVRDFRGLEQSSIDQSGNFSIGFRENLAFPEIKSDEIERTHGLEVSIATTAKNRETGLALFTLLGFPFKKEGVKSGKAGSAGKSS
ncbi:MAG: 50S ribosomal protein L5 [Patescibacteria group bacterium]